MTAERAEPSDGALVDLARRVGGALRAGGRRLATVESCTGGLVAHLITEIPGSSDYFVGALVTYSNELKEALADVPGIMGGCDPDGHSVERCRVGRWIARVTAVDDRARRPCQQGCGTCAGTRRADDVDPLAGPDLSRLAGRPQTGTDRGGVACHRARAVAVARSRTSSSAAAALCRLFAVRSPSHR